MAVFHHEVFIAQPVEKVFAAVADVKTHPQWQDGLLRTEVEGDSQARVGARGVEVRRMFGREQRFPYEITVFNPPQAWGFRTPAGPIRPSATVTFSSEKSGTLIKSELTTPGPLGFLIGPAMLSQQRRNYVRLKELLESGKL